MTRLVHATHLVVGAGAMGLAFVDALVDHGDARVVLVDRRPAPGGHWLNAYPFVRLHQASSFYGVASTPLGNGRLQTGGPEAGLHERASQPEILHYYERVLQRLLDTGRVEFHPASEYVGDRTVVSRVSGTRLEVPGTCRVVDARYLAPHIPAETPPPFAVADGARVVPVNALADVREPPSRYVVVGSGKTATDACTWLLGHGVDPGAVTWVRPRDPWLLDRARVQPDPETFLAMAADVMEAAAASTTPEGLFARLEDAGVMLRLDARVTPTMARAPTIAAWEVEQLRRIEDVVRLGHVTAVERGRVVLAGGTVTVPDDALVVNCAADGSPHPPPVPVWQPDVVTLQAVRSGFPCFGAALIGYVEATRTDDATKNGLCPATPDAATLREWVTMTERGTRATRAFTAEPDVRDWADRTALNPARVPPGHLGSAALTEAQERLAAATGPALASLAAMP
ncbi:NAD(P)-binding protein [Phycicoccus flavus]|uniref:NAD(P)-binding protein n=1 Tax=Phycicoccus flavus TaxID=2502783 RepID=UPI000FEBAB93|nr:NAD(P)-binding protein [Phycicoccus flavus]NHA66859.1 NAD(P)-binding protein [Phycicoccus flavus]